MEPQSKNDIQALFESHRLMEGFSALGVFVIDYTGKRAFSSSVWKACGYDGSNLDDELFLKLVHPDDKPELEAGINRLMTGQRDHFEGTFRMKRTDGTWAWLAATYQVAARDAQGRPALYLGHDQDISAIKQIQEEQRIRLTQIETLGEVIADVNASLDLNETVSRILEHTRRVLPYDRSSVQLLERKELRVIGCTGFADRSSVLSLRFPFPDPENPSTQAIRRRVPLICNRVEQEYPAFGRRPGEEPTGSWMGIPLLANNEVIGMLTLDSVDREVYNDRHLEMAVILAGHLALAIDKARMFADVRTMAVTDSLTRAGNRHSLNLRAPFFFDKAAREHRPIIAIMADLDHFKQVNDRFGHDVGDEVLRETARVIRSCLRRYDLFFRYGGEEFLIILPEIDFTGALEIAERIRKEVEIMVWAPLERFPTVSLGLASMVPTETMVLSDLVKVADQALYRAKAEGRNRVTFTQLDVPLPRASVET